jgi:nucleoid DNA-binding protein
MSATKKDIAKVFSEKTSIHPVNSLKIVDQFFDSIIEVLAEQGRIEIRKFGVFESKKIAPRKARNPKTGETFVTLGGHKVKFKPGKEMILKVSQENSTQVN